MKMYRDVLSEVGIVGRCHCGMKDHQDECACDRCINCNDCRGMIPDHTKTVQEIIRAANRTIYTKECKPYHMYSRYIATKLHEIQMIQEEVEELKMLREHEHMWDENDCCKVCGKPDPLV